MCLTLNFYQVLFIFPLVIYSYFEAMFRSFSPPDNRANVSLVYKSYCMPVLDGRWCKPKSLYQGKSTDDGLSRKA